MFLLSGAAKSSIYQFKSILFLTPPPAPAFLLPSLWLSSYPNSPPRKKEHPHLYNSILTQLFFLKKIPSLFAPQRKDFLQEQGITHILSAYRPSVEPKIPFLQTPTDNDKDDDKGQEASKPPKFKRMLVEIEDSGIENIIKHFPKSNAFIQDGLNAGGGVLVHW